MTRIIKPAVAGTLESSDVLVTVKPNQNEGIAIRLKSIVLTTFGEQIQNTVQEVLSSFNVSDALVELDDKGAIDSVIRARTATAICRAAEINFDWKGEDSNE